jgi:hypothetical protein
MANSDEDLEVTPRQRTSSLLGLSTRGNVLVEEAVQASSLPVRNGGHG